ncbi:hypothetical protein ACS0TY_028298 [Phlomoides rotata]
MASRDSHKKDPCYSRKEKSLGLLCTNFLRLYNREGVDSVGLDAAALQLGVERRRIYDIVNILESVGVLQKKAKNQYSWKGFGAIPGALKVLKEQGLKEDFHTYVANVANREECRGLSDSKTKELDKWSESEKEHRREKSLGLLTQNFVKLFLCSDVDLISLDRAASALLGDLHDRTAMRTKVRRLYDIANVLSSMELLEKTRDPESGKPAFRWIGTERSYKRKSSTALDEKNSKRSFGTEITNMVLKRCNTNTSTDWKSNSETRSKDELSSEAHQRSASQEFIFGPFTPYIPNSEDNGNKKDGWIQERENLVRDYKPQYSNQAVGELIHHYAEAWNYWHGEAKDKQQIEPGS